MSLLGRETAASVMAALPVARYRLEFEAVTPLHLPAYAGSTLRGAFGGALRAASCMTRQPTCEGCPLLATCPYAVVFETRPPEGGHALQSFSQVPHPYVIEPPEWGERDYAAGEAIRFHLVLAGRALPLLPLIVWAFVRGFGRGVGKGDGRARLLRVVHCGAIEEFILEGELGTIAEHETALPAPPAQARSLRLRLEPPLRLQRGGHALTGRTATPRDLLVGLVRRVALLAEFHGQRRLDLDFTALAAAAGAVADERDLRWRDWTRYSSRQKTTMALGGVVGTWTLQGELDPFLPFLYLGQWLHVGKAATFGLGGYLLEADASQPMPSKGRGHPSSEGSPVQ